MRCTHCGSTNVRMVGIVPSFQSETDFLRAGNSQSTSGNAIVCSECGNSSEGYVRVCARCGKGVCAGDAPKQIPQWGWDKPGDQVEPHIMYWHKQCVPRGTCQVCGKPVVGACVAVSDSYYDQDRFRTGHTAVRELAWGQHWHCMGAQYYHRGCWPVAKDRFDKEKREKEDAEKRYQQAAVYATLCHLSALVGMFGFRPGFLLGPLLVWLAARKVHKYMDRQGREAVNFQVTMGLVALAVIGLAGIKMISDTWILLLPAMAIFDIVNVIRAGVASHRREDFRYPLTIRFLP